ncbi:MAG TPA: DMT family transporter [Thermoprotei archaeon]|nr:DMT family transporter [Thermoprotei archaeon]
MSPSLRNRRKALGYASLLSLTFLWGTSFPAIKITVNGVGFIYYVFLRFIFASIVLIVLLAPKLNFLELRRHFKPGVVLGVIFFLGLSFQGFGMEYTSASNSAFITSLSVVILYVIEVALGREKLSLKLIGSIALSMLGVYMLSFEDSFTPNIGDMIVLVGSIFWALHIMFVGNYTRRYNLIYLLLTQVLVTMICGVIPLPFASYPSRSIILAVLPHTVYLALACTILANMLQLYGQRYIRDVNAALIYLLEPVFATILSIIILGENISLRQSIGILAIVTAVALSSREI